MHGMYQEWIHGSRHNQATQANLHRLVTSYRLTHWQHLDVARSNESSRSDEIKNRIETATIALFEYRIKTIPDT
jgi:hypothetical protein